MPFISRNFHDAKKRKHTVGAAAAKWWRNYMHGFLCIKFADIVLHRIILQGFAFCKCRGSPASITGQLAPGIQHYHFFWRCTFWDVFIATGSLQALLEAMEFSIRQRYHGLCRKRLRLPQTPSRKWCRSSSSVRRSPCLAWKKRLKRPSLQELLCLVCTYELPVGSDKHKNPFCSTTMQRSTRSS